MEASCLNDDETGAAPGPRLVIGNEVLSRQPALGEVGLMAGRKDAIADLRVAQPEGGEEAREVGHELSNGANGRRKGGRACTLAICMAPHSRG